jgi:hypothetical protein
LDDAELMWMYCVAAVAVNLYHFSSFAARLMLYQVSGRGRGDADVRVPGLNDIVLNPILNEVVLEPDAVSFI